MIFYQVIKRCINFGTSAESYMILMRVGNQKTANNNKTSAMEQICVFHPVK